VSLGFGLGMGLGGLPSRGPELVTVPVGTGWSVTGTGASVDGTGLHFVSGANVAAGFKTLTGLKDNTTYEVKITVANWVIGPAKSIVYGPSLAHAGASANHTGNGVYTDLLTTNGAGSSQNQIRIQCTGTTGNNTFDVTSVSVKEVLGA
jgi:hypothetical protein